MTSATESAPSDPAAAHAMILAERTARLEAEARLANAQAEAALFARFIDDGRICLTNNAAERALRGFALGRKSWLFAGSERDADRDAVMATLIITAKLTTSIRRSGSPTCSRASTIAKSTTLPRCHPGTGESPWRAALKRRERDGT